MAGDDGLKVIQQEGGLGDEQVIPRSSEILKSTVPEAELIQSGLSTERPETKARSYDLIELN